MIASGLLLVAAAAQAQQRGACAREVRKLCPDMRAGTPEFRSCFEEHKQDFSERCRNRLTQGQERIDKMRETCEGDIAKLCSEVDEGGGQVLRCLVQHTDDLSDACKETMPRRPRRAAGPAKAPGKAPAKAPAQAEAPEADEPATAEE